MTNFVLVLYRFLPPNPNHLMYAMYKQQCLCGLGSDCLYYMFIWYTNVELWFWVYNNTSRSMCHLSTG